MIEDGPAVCCKALVLHEKCASIMLPMAFVSIRLSVSLSACVQPGGHKVGGRNSLPKREKRATTAKSCEQEGAIERASQSRFPSIHSLEIDQRDSAKLTDRTRAKLLPSGSCVIIQWTQYLLFHTPGPTLSTSRQEDLRVSHVCNSRRAACLEAG